MDHLQGMHLALQQAGLAEEAGEIPLGAGVVRWEEVLSTAFNRTHTDGDYTAHAELLAIRQAAKRTGGRLQGCTLYCTLEPCAMCAGAAINTRLTTLVYGAFDEVSGCSGSVLDLPDHCFLHSIETWGGILEEECKAPLTAFFAAKRIKQSE